MISDIATGQRENAKSKLCAINVGGVDTDLNEDGDTPNRKEENATPRVVRIRIMDPIFLSLAAFGIGVLSYLGTVDSREDATRHKELSEVESRARDYTDQRINNVEGGLNSHRAFAKEVNNRQDEKIEYVRKLIIQVAK